MFFVLSKVLFFLLAPLTWMIILLLAIVWVKKAATKRRLKIMLIALVFIFTNPYIYRSLVKYWQSNPVTLSNHQVYEAGILLGGFSGYDKYDKGFFKEAADRFIQATNLYHQGIIKKIIMTGGSGALLQNEPSESVFVFDQLLKNGVAKNDIILEHASRNTYENAVFTKKIIDSLKLNGPFVLITSAIHMPRSEKLFRKAGLQVQPYPCAYDVYDERFNLEDTIIPDTRLPVFWKYLLKEMVGTWIYQLIGKA